jgi:hypothetical protein
MVGGVEPWSWGRGAWSGSGSGTDRVWARGAGTIVREPPPGGEIEASAGRPSHQRNVEDELAGANRRLGRGTRSSGGGGRWRGR